MTEQYERRISNALLLCAELLDDVRQLSIHARTAVITGEQNEEAAYKRILNARAARLERYQHSSSVFGPEAEKGYLALISGLSLTPAEEQELRQAFNTSMQLARMETMALNMAKGLYADASGNYTVSGSPDRERALELLFSENYTRSLLSVMTYFNELYERLSHHTDASRQKSDLHVNILLGLGCAIMAAVLSATMLPLRKNSRGEGGRRMLLAYAATMLIVLCSVAVPAGLVYRDARNVIIGTMEERQHLLTSEIRRELELRIKHCTEIARIFAARPAILNVFTEPAGTPAREDVLVQAQILLREVSTSYMDVASAVLLNRNNQLLAQGAVNKDTPTLTGLPPETFHKLLRGQPQVLTMEFPHGEELLVAVPVRSGEKVDGVLVMVMDRRHALSFWNGRMSDKERVGLFIIDQQGLVIVSSLGEKFEGVPIYSPHGAALFCGKPAGPSSL